MLFLLGSSLFCHSWSQQKLNNSAMSSSIRSRTVCLQNASSHINNVIGSLLNTGRGYFFWASRPQRQTGMLQAPQQVNYSQSCIYNSWLVWQQVLMTFGSNAQLFRQQLAWVLFGILWTPERLIIGWLIGVCDVQKAIIILWITIMDGWRNNFCSRT